jgi:hypothetical protein
MFILICTAPFLWALIALPDYFYRRHCSVVCVIILCICNYLYCQMISYLRSPGKEYSHTVLHLVSWSCTVVEHAVISWGCWSFAVSSSVLCCNVPQFRRSSSLYFLPSSLYVVIWSNMNVVFYNTDWFYYLYSIVITVWKYLHYLFSHAFYISVSRI